MGKHAQCYGGGCNGNRYSQNSELALLTSLPSALSATDSPEEVRYASSFARRRLREVLTVTERLPHRCFDGFAPDQVRSFGCA